MSNSDFFAERFELEQKAFRKVLQAVPGDQLGYRPHERSASAGGLAWQLAEEQRGIVELLDRGETKYENRPRPATIDEIVAAWDAATADVHERLGAKDEAKWSEPAKFLVGDQVVWTDTLQNMLWGFLFDMVHHRGQLSTYLRPMGAKVPAIYGPSGDDQGE
jgi:uncharacterized damage-inducible protein DinB